MTGRKYIEAMLADMREEWAQDEAVRRARAVVAFQPDTQDRPAIPDEDGWAALHTLVAAAFGDARAFRASIPARDDDTDLVAGRWVRQLVAERGLWRDPELPRVRVRLVETSDPPEAVDEGTWRGHCWTVLVAYEGPTSAYVEVRCGPAPSRLSPVARVTAHVLDPADLCTEGQAIGAALLWSHCRALLLRELAPTEEDPHADD